MKINRKDLLEQVEIAAKVAPLKTPKQILTMARLTFDGHTLTTAAFDGEVGVTSTLKGGDGRAFDLLVDARKTQGVLKNMIGTDVELIITDSHVEFRAGKDKMKVPVQSPEEFPTWSLDGEVSHRPINGHLFKEIVGRCKNAMDQESTRYALSGFHLRVLEDGTLRVEATNGRILCAEPLGDGFAGCHPSVVVPAKSALVAASSLASEATLAITRNRVEFRDDAITITSMLVEGKFPDTNQVLFGHPVEAEIIVNINSLLQILTKAQLVATAEKCSVDWELKDGHLRATAGTSDTGFADCEIPVNVDDEAVVSVDGALFHKFLSGLDPMADLSWSMAKNTANVLKTGSWTGVIMPLSRDP